MDINTAAGWANIIAVPIAIFFGLLSTLLAVILFRRGQQRKNLTCTFDDIRLPVEITSGELAGDPIQILFRNKPIRNLFIVRACLKNTGTLPIRHGDVISPLKFTLASGGSILSEPQILSQMPANLVVKATLENVTDSGAQSARLDFDLLNPGDEVLIEMFCTGTNQLPEISARIEGVNKIERTAPPTVDPVARWMVAWYVNFAAVAVLGVIVSVVLSNTEWGALNSTLWIPVFTAGVISSVWIPVYDRIQGPLTRLAKRIS